MSIEQTTATDDAREIRQLTSRALAAGESPVPRRVVLAPWGMVRSAGGDFVVDEESGRLIREALTRQGTDIPIDYEHQTLGGRYASPTGQAPAAGWIKSLDVVPDEGLVAVVDWTPAATDRLVAREYRYLSPVALVRKRDRRLVGLHSAALTNKPAIEGMQPIVNRTVPDAAPPESAEALRCRLELQPEAGLDELLATACRRIDELTSRMSEHAAHQRVLRARRAGKLTEAQQQWATELALKAPASFDEWERTAPVVVVPGATAPPVGPGTRSTAHVERAARAEYRAHPELAALTDEDAYVADAIRAAG